MTPPIRENGDGILTLHPGLFDLLVDLTDEDSRPIVDVFWFVREPLPPAARVGIVREWLTQAGARGWIETSDPSYPVTVAASIEDIDPWLEQNGEAFAAGRLAYNDVRCPEISATLRLCELLDSGAVVREPSADRARP